MWSAIVAHSPRHKTSLEGIENNDNDDDDNNNNNNNNNSNNNNNYNNNKANSLRFSLEISSHQGKKIPCNRNASENPQANA